MFQIDAIHTHDCAVIATNFNTFFASIGLKLASDMPTNNAVTFKDFIRHDRHLTDFTFQPITEKDTLMMINALKSKNSCGHDGLSTIILKAIKHDICKPITLIINQSLYTGIFPNKLKLAKVIPIYKKGDNTKLDN